MVVVIIGISIVVGGLFYFCYIRRRHKAGVFAPQGENVVQATAETVLTTVGREQIREISARNLGVGTFGQGDLKINEKSKTTVWKSMKQERLKELKCDSSRGRFSQQANDVRVEDLLNTSQPIYEDTYDEPHCNSQTSKRNSNPNGSPIQKTLSPLSFKVKIKIDFDKKFSKLRQDRNSFGELQPPN